MLTNETCHRIIAACVPGGEAVRVQRSGRKVWALRVKNADVMVSDTLEAIALAVEAEARKTPVTCTSPDTHLFGQPCTVVLPDVNDPHCQRGDFYLVSASGLRVHLRWYNPGTRWIATTEFGEQLKYGPKKDFKLAWTKADRAQPALQAWLSY